MVICLEQGADLHTAQLMPLPLTVSCFSKVQIGFTFLVLAYPGSPGKGPLNVCVCVCQKQIVSGRFSDVWKCSFQTTSFPVLSLIKEPSTALIGHDG